MSKQFTNTGRDIVCAASLIFAGFGGSAVGGILVHRIISSAYGAMGSLPAFHSAAGTSPAAVASTRTNGSGSATYVAMGSLPAFHGAAGTNPAAVASTPINGSGSATYVAMESPPMFHRAAGTNPAAVGSTPVHEEGSAGPYRNGRCVYSPRCADGKCSIAWRNKTCTVPPSLRLFDPPAGADFLLRLLHGLPVSIVRFSDGEILAAAGRLSADSGGRVSAKLRSMVRESFEDDPGKVRTLRFLNLNWICRDRAFYQRMDAILSRIPKDRVPCFVSHFGFLESMDRSPVEFRLAHNDLFRGNCVLVGPKHFSEFAKPDSAFLRCLAHIEVPCCNAGLPQLARFVAAAVNATSLLKRGVGFVFVSAGLLSKALVPALAQHVGRSHSIIDTGSSLDVFAGIHSRDYNRREYVRTWCSRYPEFMGGQCR